MSDEQNFYGDLFESLPEAQPLTPEEAKEAEDADGKG